MGFNFRDVGPLVGSGGARVGAGVLFRSGCPGRTSVEGFGAAVRDHGIRSVVDLRGADERTEADAYYEPLSGVKFAALPFLTTIEDGWRHPRSHDALSGAGRYLEMIEASDALRNLFEWLVRPEHLPVLIHCAAGRDRTGMAYALVLGTLGVDTRLIAADYALSHTETDDGYGAMPETLLELFTLVDRNYGGLASLLDRRGVNEDLRLRLRAAFR